MSAPVEEVLEFLKSGELGGGSKLAEGSTLRISPRLQEILSYSKKLTLAPGQMTSADVDRLKAEGLIDREIHDLCSIVSYFAFVNRIADGLGVDLETTQEDQGTNPSGKL